MDGRENLSSWAKAAMAGLLLDGKYTPETCMRFFGSKSGSGKGRILNGEVLQFFGKSKAEEGHTSSMGSTAPRIPKTATTSA